MFENARRHRRERVRLQHDFTAPHGAPAAHMAFTGFNEVNRPLQFRAPLLFFHPAAVIIDLDK
jgi:hypothetical protein